MSTILPIFTDDDTLKALQVTVKDSSGTPKDISAGQVRLFARGQNNNDRPGYTTDPWTGLLGDFVTDGTDGVVQFIGVGATCTIGTGRAAQIYAYQIEYAEGSQLTRTPPLGHFIVYRSLT